MSSIALKYLMYCPPFVLIAQVFLVQWKGAVWVAEWLQIYFLIKAIHLKSNYSLYINRGQHKYFFTFIDLTIILLDVMDIILFCVHCISWAIVLSTMPPPPPDSSGDGFVSGPRSVPHDLEGTAGQWEPTLAELLLRHSLGTDGASLGWDPGQGRVPAMNRHWFTLRLRTEGLGCRRLLLRSWPLLVAGSSVGREERGVGGRQMGVWERVVVSSQGTGFILQPPGQLQDLCSMCVGRAAC